MRIPKEKTFDNLCKMFKGTIYLHCKTLEISTQMFSNAIVEGYRVPLGYKTWKTPELIVLNSVERQLAGGCGFYRHMDHYRNCNVFRIDYGKYISGEADIFHHGIKFYTGIEKLDFESRFFGNISFSGWNCEKAYEYYRLNRHLFNTQYDEEFLFEMIEKMYKVLVVMPEK